MCELLGMSFKLAIQSNISFIGFQKRALENPDGWGIAYYPDKSAVIIKEPKRLDQSMLSKFIFDNLILQSKIIIGHVRKASIGIISYKNTHPFSREFRGRDYVFAHNGTILYFKKLELSNYHPIGNTDSEHLFCHLLHLIKIRDISNWENDDFVWLKDQLNMINQNGRLNCIFSDGKHLFCYKDQYTENSLCLIKKKSPFEKKYLKDEDWDINFNEIQGSNQEGYIISSKKLTDENWKELNKGDLLVLKNGEIIFGNV
ncbi:MAG: class II glutamine amidotransferase [Candidatus Lokiarchaeota archaeon]|nr:class II glutamine amidotransferase [Candidatus Lokiarchaeota archaeon]